jgi:hypothetical protein
MNHLRQLRREQAVIEAMHRKPFWRVGILHRRPWRSGLKRSNGESLFSWIRSWLFVIHDCKDPAIGCSCSGGFRFPTNETDCSDGCGAKQDAHCWNKSEWADGTHPS